MKKKTAKLCSVVGSYGDTFKVIWDSLPDGVKKHCRGVDLAELCDVMRKHYDFGHDKGFWEGVDVGEGKGIELCVEKGFNEDLL